MKSSEEAFRGVTPRLNRTEKRSGIRIRRLKRACVLMALAAAPAHASLFQGETLDQVADIVAWVALIIAPVTVITVFWLIHILPEKIAEQRKHPQAKAIQVVCLLSLFFGGLLWPIAWIWAYSKPVLHKLAYGTDVHEEDEEAGTPKEAAERDREHRKNVAERDAGVSIQPVSTRERA